MIQATAIADINVIGSYRKVGGDGGDAACSSIVDNRILSRGYGSSTPVGRCVPIRAGATGSIRSVGCGEAERNDNRCDEGDSDVCIAESGVIDFRFHVFSGMDLLRVKLPMVLGSGARV
jgi:hypothetical protein